MLTFCITYISYMRAHQSILEVVKFKVKTFRDPHDTESVHTEKETEICARNRAKEPTWLLEAEVTLEEKQELISRLIVISQQAFFMAKVC